MVSEGQDETTQEISEDEERSSIEFEKYFDEILSLSFEKNANRQLLMVIDNLDRIDSEVSLRIWSTLQTFLKQRNPHSKDQYHAGNIWIIVPYDLGGLSKLWQITDDSEHKDDCPQSFFDKCFQLRFEVPRPVLTDWEDFCSQMVSQAFGENFNNVERVINVLKLTREDLKDIPTPREIKTYVNQLGVLLLSNEDNKPIESLAYYVIQRYIKRKSVKDLQAELITGKTPNKSHITNLPNTIIKDLAGLSFGVSSVIGQQLLLEPEIEKALSDNDSGKLEQLVETHEAGFWFVFDHHINGGNTDTFSYASIVNEAFGEKYRNKLKRFINSLRKTDVQFNESNELDNHLAYLSFVSKLGISLKPYWNKLGNHLGEKFNEANFDPSIYSDFVSKVDELVDDKDKTPKIISATDAVHWLKWFDASHEANWIKWFVPSDAAITEIGKKIPANTIFPKEINSTIKALMRIDNTNWAGLITPLRNHLIWNNGTPQGHSHSIEALKCIYDLSFLKNENIDTLITKILKNNTFFNYVYHKRVEDDTIFFASVLLAKYYKNNLHIHNLPDIGNSSGGMVHIRRFWTTRDKDNAQRVYDELHRSDQELLWELVHDQRNKLMIDVVNIAASSVGDFFEGDDSYSRFLDALTLFGEEQDVDRKAISKQFVEETDIIQELSDTENIDIKENSQALFFLVPYMEKIQSISNFVKQLGQEDWGEELNEDTHLSSLSVELYKRGGLKLNKAYYDCLLQFVERWFNGEQTPTEWQLNHWSELINILEDAFLKQFSANLTKLVSNNLGHCNPSFFKINKDFIDVKWIVQDRNREIQLFIENLLKGELETEKLKFFVSLLDAEKPNFDDSFGKVVSEDISRHFNEGKDSVKEDLEKLAYHLNVDIETISTEEN